MKQKRCDFRRTNIWFGPKDGVHSKKWRCSRNALHDHMDYALDESGNRTVEMPVKLCTQHLKVAQNNARRLGIS